MDTRKKLLSAAVAGLFAMGVAAQPLVASANEGEEGGEHAAEKNHCKGKGKGNHCGGAAKGKGEGKDSCKGHDGCGAKKKKGAEEHHEE